MRVIILDYDDTLFPTSHVAKHDLYVTPINSPGFLDHRGAFQEVESAAISFLSKAIEIGDFVAIVTNGKLDWIRHSMKMFYHRLYDFIRKNKMLIMSAQDIFAGLNPHPLVWKVNCFRHLLGSLRSANKEPTMLISVGDGADEAIACEVSAREFGICHRNVNLLEAPSPSQMTKQLSLLLVELPTVVDCAALGTDFKSIIVSEERLEIQASYNSAVFSADAMVSTAPMVEQPPLPNAVAPQEGVVM